MKLRNWLIFGCVALALLGCGKKEKAPTNSVTIWHWMIDRNPAFQELAQKYTDQTGIKVTFELFAPSNAYTQKIVASAHAKVLPDVYGILDQKSKFASFVKAGFVADLTAEYAANNHAWRNVLFNKALDSVTFKEGNVDGVTPGIYGVPLDVTNVQMVYNKKLLAKAGIASAPQTFGEFILAAEALKRIGVPVFVSGFGELWLADAFASNYAFNIMGEDKIMATYRGEVPYTDPDWVNVFDVFKIMTDKGMFMEGTVNKGNKFAEQDFALERAAFSFNGSWAVNVYNDMNSSLEYGVMLPPAISSEHPMRIWGGAGSSFVVNGHSPNKKLAIDFLKWLTAKEQQEFLSQQTNNLPSNKEALANIPEVLAGFAASTEHTTHPTIWPLNEDPLVIEALDKGLQEIMIGDKTPEQVAAKVQAVKLKAIEKAARRKK